MPYLYRTALIVSRKQPYIDWANGLATEESERFPDDLATRRDVYLGPQMDHQPTVDEAIADNWPEIFDEALYAWSTDEATWPADRTRAMFDDWFEAELADSTIDLVPDEPLNDAEMDVADVNEAMSYCAWCGAELGDGQGRIVPFALSDPERLAHRDGRAVDLMVRPDRLVLGVIAPPSEEGEDEGERRVIVWACSRPCEKRLEKHVPAALRQFEEKSAD